MEQRPIKMAQPDDLDQLLRLIDAGRQRMRAEGNTVQWSGGQPSVQQVEATIAAGEAFLMYDETGHAVATFVLQTAPEANYAEIEGAWLNEEPYLTIHRVAAEASAHGVMRAIQSFAETKAAERGIANLRIDTHERNESMRHVIALLGYTYCGHIVVSDGTLRLAFQKGLDNVAQ